MNFDHLWLAVFTFGFFDGLLGVYSMHKEGRYGVGIVCTFLSITSLYFAIDFAVNIFK